MRCLLLALLIVAPLPVVAQEFFTLKGHGGPIMDIAVSQTGQIATASFDNSVGLWHGTDPQWLEGHRAAVTKAYFANAETLLTGGDDFRVLVWHPDLEEPFELGTHQGKISDVAVSQDMDVIASASWDGTIAYMSELHLFKTVASPPLSVIKQSLTGHKGPVTAIEFDTNGSLYSASVDGTIRVWRVGMGEFSSRVVVKHGFGINKLFLNPENRWLAYGSVDGTTRIIDLDTAAEIKDFSLNRRPILAMAYDPVGRQLAVGDGEGYIMVIDTTRWRITRDFRATDRGPIWALAFSPDGTNIHAGGIADVMYSWPVETMDEFGQMNAGVRTFLEDPATLPNGERQFKRKCSICHTLTPGSARRAGPTLYALFGRAAGAVDDYSYSKTLTGSDIVWSDETIDQLFDIGPDHYIPGTKMPMQRISGVEDRQDLIAYLKAATAPSNHREDDK